MEGGFSFLGGGVVTFNGKMLIFLNIIVPLCSFKSHKFLL